MSIHYDEATKQFYLHTRNTSYVMELYRGCLAHNYWGPKLEHCPTQDTMFPFHTGVSFCATDLPGNITDSTDVLPQEYPTFGSADLREPALQTCYSNGDQLTKLRYKSHRIYAGKSKLEGLPATYGTAEQWETLEITMLDDFTGLCAVLNYSIFYDLDILTRSVKILNNGNAVCQLAQAASCCVDFHDDRFEVIHLPGSWGRERHIFRTPVSPASFRIESRRGSSSHNQNPFLALVRPETTETAGDAYGFCLVYSGSFMGSVSGEQFGSTRVQLGINPHLFSWELVPGESFQTPEVIMVYSQNGLGEMSRRFHRVIRDHLCRGQFRDIPRPVLINNWEATYFNFNEEKILTLAEKAKQIGVDLMVLDDGWFGKRNTDNCSLGDWVPNPEKLPDGLSGLANKINAMGMQFGLWFEPEMVSPDSDLYRAHPDWCIHTPGRSRTEGRQQLILDLSKPEVCEHIIQTLSEILENNPISYVKWDMNRNMTEIPYSGHPHRYILGLYQVLETITTRFPNILFESCSGGGGRFDAGMMHYMPQIWTSDDSDAIERLFIQEGTGLVYPTSVMGAHVSAVPNHQIHRVTPLDIRSKVAFMGRYGLELDLNKLDQAELNALSSEIAQYKQIQQMIHRGDLYRLLSPYQTTSAAYQIISEDGNTVLVFLFNIKGIPNMPAGRVFLQGLEHAAHYMDESTGDVFDGASLMHAGIALDRRFDMLSNLKIYRRITE